MGIGVYESAQYVASIGGEISIDSNARRRHVGRVAAAAQRFAGRLAADADEGASRMTDMRKPLLIVEDDPALQKQMQWAFDQYETIVANDRASAIAQVRRFEPAVVTMDLGLPPQPDDPAEGFKLLEELHALVPDAKVIVLTGQNDRANALKAIGMGAHDFCAKPFEPELLTWTIDRAFRVHELQEENTRLQSVRESPATSGIITRDPDMLRICRTIEKVAADVGHRADPRRVGDRQGAARARAA